MNGKMMLYLVFSIFILLDMLQLRLLISCRDIAVHEGCHNEKFDNYLKGLAVCSGKCYKYSEIR